MRSLLIAALAVSVLIGVDAWLCIRTMTPGALAKPPRVRRLRLFRTMVITYCKLTGLGQFSLCGAAPAAWRCSPRSAASNYWRRCSGPMGQVSGPEQNPIVTELAGPSQHLLPATSKTASGSSSLNTSSS